MYWKYPFTAPVHVSQNWVTNPSMEAGVTTGWGNLANAGSLTTVTRTASTLYGERTGQFASVAAGGAAIRANLAPTVPGQAWSGSALLRVPATARDGRVGVLFYDGGGVAIGGPVFGSTVPVGTADATAVVQNVVAPPLATSAALVVSFTNSTAGQLFQFDGALLIRSTTVRPYFDGNSPAIGNEVPRWLGTTNLSESVLESPGLADTLTPLVDVVTPYGIRRTLRTQARELMQAAKIRFAYFAPGARHGTLRIGFATAADAVAGMAWFATNSTFYLDHSESYADMHFAVAEGDLEFERDEVEGVILLVPFKELT